jgi:hypothetical protein
VARIRVTFSANPHATCGDGTGWATSDSVTVRLTTLGVFHGTQAVPLGSAAAIMTERRC